MVVGGSNHDRLGLDAAAFMYFLTRCLDEILGSHNGINTDKRDWHCAIIENSRPNFAGIVKAFHEVRQIVTGHLHADIGRDIALGETCLQ